VPETRRRDNLKLSESAKVGTTRFSLESADPPILLNKNAPPLVRPKICTRSGLYFRIRNDEFPVRVGESFVLKEHQCALRKTFEADVCSVGELAFGDLEFRCAEVAGCYFGKSRHAFVVDACELRSVEDIDTHTADSHPRMLRLDDPLFPAGVGTAKIAKRFLCVLAHERISEEKLRKEEQVDVRTLPYYFVQVKFQ